MSNDKYIIGPIDISKASLSDEESLERAKRELFGSSEAELRKAHERMKRQHRALSPERRERPGSDLETTKDYGARFNLIAARIERGDATIVHELLRAKAVNRPLNKRGETPLHVAASVRARAVVKALIATGDCDVLLRDTKGRLASELAFLYGDDVALTRYLFRLEARAKSASVDS